MAGYRFSFSYSRWSTYSKCPQSFKFQYIDKIDTGPTPPALLKGRKVHDEIAKFVDNKAEEMPDSLRLFTQMADGIRALPKSQKYVEEQVAFDKGKKQVGWFGPNAYWRFIWDVLVQTRDDHVDAIDWKTGKPYDSYDDQKQLFALPAFWMSPELQTFTGHWVYLDHGEVHTATFNREQVLGPSNDIKANEGLSGMWSANAGMMESDQVFRATPSKSACRFCDFGPNKLNVCPDGVLS